MSLTLCLPLQAASLGVRRCGRHAWPFRLPFTTIAGSPYQPQVRSQIEGKQALSRDRKFSRRRGRDDK
jgi:hypothetical protein